MCFACSFLGYRAYVKIRPTVVYYIRLELADSTFVLDSMITKNKIRDKYAFYCITLTAFFNYSPNGNTTDIIITSN